jgi:hypothetical protein
MGTGASNTQPNVTLIDASAAANNRASAIATFQDSGQGPGVSFVFEDDSGNADYYLAAWRNGTAGTKVEIKPPLTLDAKLTIVGGGADITGNVTSTGFVSSSAGVFSGGISCAGGQLHLGGVGTTGPSVEGDGVNVIINPSGSGAARLNWESGTGGTVFGNGAGVQVAKIDSAGNAAFNGNFQAGTLNVNPGVFADPPKISIAYSNGRAYFDCYGPDTSTLGAYSFRILPVGVTGYMEALLINPNGSIYVSKNLQSGGAIVGSGRMDTGELINLQTYSAFMVVSAGAPTHSFFVAAGDGGTVGTLHLGGVGPGGQNYRDFGVFGVAGATISGDLACTGTKSFLIKHPTKPGAFLLHACLEGPEAGVYYRGEGETVDGKTTITLPEYFEALTMKDGRTVQITQVDDDSADFASFKVSRVIGGKFTVKSNVPAAKFFWQVNAIRADVEPLTVEVEKDSPKAKELAAMFEKPVEEPAPKKNGKKAGKA